MNDFEFFLEDNFTRNVKGGGSGERLAVVVGTHTGGLLGVQVRGHQVEDEGIITRIEREKAGIQGHL